MSTKTLTELVKTKVDLATKERLEAAAAREERSIAFILRRLIREGLARDAA